MHNFWESLPTPFFVQAPMEDVTDAAFRRLISTYSQRASAPYVSFTEFTSADGLVLAPERGQTSLRKKLVYSDIERPIVAQLFSAYPDRMERASAIVASMGFDGIDINMGCPDKAVEKSGCGSAMIKNPILATEIIRAAKRGGGGLPVSVKTRIGYANNEIATWVPTLLSEGIANLTIHARTRNEMSDVPARWEHVAEAVTIRDRMGVSTRITGNGDVRDLADARTKIAQTGCDGAMLGRAIYGNPWLFAEHIPTPHERIRALIEHLALFDEILTGVVNYATMKKHFKAYISGWDDAKELRMQLMETHTVSEAVTILESFHRSL